SSSSLCEEKTERGGRVATATGARKATARWRSSTGAMQVRSSRRSRWQCSNEPSMKVLVVGSGAREHALVWKCVQSDLVERVYCAAGNGGTGGMARNIPIGVADVVRIVEFSKRERLGLVILGPEASVDAGVGDALRSAGFNVFGPNRGAGRIESSKSFAKQLMVRAGIPTAEFGVFIDPLPAKEWAAQ